MTWTWLKTRLKNMKIIEFVDEMLLNPLIKKDREFSLLAQTLINDFNDISSFSNLDKNNHISEELMVTNKNGLCPEIRKMLTQGRMIRL